jgi:cellulose synthase/poly-beta-1,6-N-acetylglucosamine synthase-like glycosyltransferase
MIEIFFIVVISLIFIIHLTLILLWNFNYKTYSKTIFTELPKVSILIACRNEASNVSKLITNLLELDYPKDKLEILIGNDASEDNTLELLETINVPHIHIFDISISINELKGKMNVLAQLAQNSSGEFLLLTDADMQHSSKWIYSMLESCDKNTGAVAGYTSIKTDNLFSIFQLTDYLFGQSIMKILIDLEIPMYASGNNMLIRKNIYSSIGGYENMSFHLTEDILMLKAISSKGYQIKSNFNANSISRTYPLNNLFDVIQQRKRWMKGFSLMPIWAIIFPILRLSYLPLIALIAFTDPILAGFTLLIKSIINLSFSLSINYKLKMKPNLITAVFYDFYELIIYLPALFLHMFSKSIIWKNRKL